MSVSAVLYLPVSPLLLLLFVQQLFPYNIKIHQDDFSAFWNSATSWIKRSSLFLQKITEMSLLVSRRKEQHRIEALACMQNLAVEGCNILGAFSDHRTGGEGCRGGRSQSLLCSRCILQFLRSKMDGAAHSARCSDGICLKNFVCMLWS